MCKSGCIARVRGISRADASDITLRRCQINRGIQKTEHQSAGDCVAVKKYLSTTALLLLP